MQCRRTGEIREMSVYLVTDHLSVGANNLRAFTEKAHHRNSV